MQWFKVEDQMPPDGVPLLLLIEISTPMASKPYQNVICTGEFSRRYGWLIRFAPREYEKGCALNPVLGWMLAPDLELPNG